MHSKWYNTVITFSIDIIERSICWLSTVTFHNNCFVFP